MSERKPLCPVCNKERRRIPRHSEYYVTCGSPLCIKERQRNKKDYGREQFSGIKPIKRKLPPTIYALRKKREDCYICHNKKGAAKNVCEKHTNMHRAIYIGTTARIFAKKQSQKLLSEKKQKKVNDFFSQLKEKAEKIGRE